MHDALEDYIDQNKSQLEEEFDSEKVWQNISNELKPTASIWRYTNTYWKVAAIVFFVLGAYLIAERFQEKKVTNEWLAQINEVEHFYLADIQTKLTTLKKETIAEKELRENFLNDLALLDSSYVQLKKELQENPNEKVLSAMIMNLQMRTEILTEQLRIIQHINQIKNEKTQHI